ncbi:tyrosine-type recombinase/integrase [Burkholderia pseudomallei]|uniref:tyrosine-type recombinase/integrase n=1 Tax=Burkholderia pseudomallei TaxID=28450 RepID=UPI000A1A127F|nr:integrase arm-type DNA-binding domain-containing protein [Burkholderia pseudomallei]ARK89403.1 integrase [Burkholderia pseudomallei]ARL95581.1 integrase [Burkholderia pseudomallei]ARM01573.1 integrase [Burkholderia pseudomallei]
MPLTDIQVRNAKASAAPYKLTDGNGMYLLVQPNGAKYWRLSYRFLGKQKTLALGVYPAVTLATARKKRDEAREQIAAGVDPSEAKKDAKRAAEIAAANSFEAVAREWFDSQRPGWSDGYAEKVLNSLEVDVFPKIGPRPIAEIDSPQMLSIVREVEARGVAHAERNQVTAAYVHAEYLPERRRMMQVWGDHLDRLKAGAEVIRIASAR